MSRDLLVSVEGNLYSVPARYVGAWVEVQAGPGDTIDIYHEVEVRDRQCMRRSPAGRGAMDSPQLSRLYEMAKRLRLLTLNGRLESLLQEAAEKELLGHSQSAVTLDTYSHMLPSLQREAVESLDRLLVM